MRLFLPIALAAQVGCAGWTPEDTLAVLVGSCSGVGYGVGEVAGEAALEKAEKLMEKKVEPADAGQADAGLMSIDAGPADAGVQPAASEVMWAGVSP